MVIALKILLIILIIGFVFTSYFTISEYKKFKKTPESEEGSIFDKFIISLLAFGGIAFFSVMIIFSVLLIFSKITVNLPF